MKALTKSYPARALRAALTFLVALTMGVTLSSVAWADTPQSGNDTPQSGSEAVAPLDESDLKEVTPEAPKVYPGPLCGQNPYVSVPFDLNLKYTQTRDGDIVTVTVTANEGYTIAPGATTEWKFDLSDPKYATTTDCINEIELPALPTIKAPTCTAGEVTTPAEVIYPEAEHVKFVTYGELTSGSKLVVIAFPEPKNAEGVRWEFVGAKQEEILPRGTEIPGDSKPGTWYMIDGGVLPDGVTNPWVQNPPEPEPEPEPAPDPETRDFSPTSWRFTVLEVPDCEDVPEKPTPEKPTTPTETAKPKELAASGANGLELAAAGAAASLSAAGLYLLRRKLTV